MKMEHGSFESHRDAIVQIPTPIKAIPAISFNVAAGIKRVTNEPNTTANSVETTRALAAATNTDNG